MVYLKRSFFFILTFWITWHFAALFEIYPHVSAFYIPPGLSVAFITVYGWRYIPVIFIAAILTAVPEVAIWELRETDLLHSLRQAAVYGLAGYILHKVWLSQSQRFSLRGSVSLFAVALAASFVSAVAARQVFDVYGSVPAEALGSVLWSFWGGDYAGVMLTTPIALLLADRIGKPGRVSLIENLGSLSFFLQIWILIACTLFSGAVAFFSHEIQTGLNIEIFVIIPVTLVALSFGVLSGILAAILSSAPLLVAHVFIDTGFYQAIEFQILLGITASLALIAGGVCDDKELAQRKIAFSDDRFKRSQRYAKIGTWEWNVQTEELIWSDHVSSLFGYDESKLEPSRQNFINAVHPDDRQMLTDAVRESVENGAKYDIEFRTIWPDGSVHWISEVGEVERQEDGAPVRMLGVTANIDARRHAMDSLDESRSQISRAAEIASLCHWRADATLTQWLETSKNTSDILGIQAENLLGHFDKYLARVHPDDRDRLAKSYAAISHDPQNYDLEYRIIGDDGDIRYLWEVTEPKYDTKGNLVSFSGTTQNITARKVVEFAAIQAMEKAEAANYAKSEFLSSMSHELRTPMNAIMGFAQMLQHNPKEPLTEAQNSYIDFILRGSDHLMELIKQVLELSKIEAGELPLAATHVSAREVFLNSLGMIRSRANREGVEIIDQTVGDDLPVLWVDGFRLTQVLLNLLSNAVKYNRKNGTVTLSCREMPDQMLRISIADTGDGIPSRKQKDLFKPFDRLGRESGPIEGSGIGLTIAKQIIELLGGNIGFESEEGKGSTFWVDVPISQKQNAEDI